MVGTMSLALEALLGPVAGAAPTDCQPAEAATFCAFGSSETNLVTQADVDAGSANLTSAAWVISGDQTVRLPAGATFTPGTSVISNLPAVWVRDQATLEIEDGDVSLAANVYLCDDATLAVRRGSLRIAQPAPFAYWTWAAGNSRIVLDDAHLRVHQDDLGISDHYTALRGRASLEASGGLEVSGGRWNLVVADEATATVRDGSLLGEFSVAGDGALTVERTQYVTLTVNPCDTETTLADLPPACDLASSCVQPDHPLTDYVRADPPKLTIDETKVLAWRLETLPGAEVTLSDIDPLAQLIVELEEITASGPLTLPAGASPTGVTDRSVVVGSEPVLGWSVVPPRQASLEIHDGSVLASVLLDDARMTIRDSALTHGTLRVSGNGVAEVVRSTVSGLVELIDGSLFAQESTFSGPLVLQDRAWVADTTLPAAVEVSKPDGWLGEVALTRPDDGSTVERGTPIDIGGTVAASTGPVAATVSLYSGSGVLATSAVSAAVDNGPLASFATDGLGPGTYTVVLRFDDGNAAATRDVNVSDQRFSDTGPVEDTGNPTDPSDTGASAAGGCGCRTTSPAFAWLALLGLLVARRRSADRERTRPLGG